MPISNHCRAGAFAAQPGMSSSNPAALAASGRSRARRGSALVLTLIITLSLAALAASAIYLGSNAQTLANSYNDERDLRYAAEATLAMGKSTLNFDPYAAPDTGYRTVSTGVAVTGADGMPVPGVAMTMYIGPTSSSTGQFGRFVSVVAAGRNSRGAQVVRRLELAQESFAKFAYWSNKETSNGTPIYFNNNDQLWGPVWSNDQINIGSGTARFRGTVGTAKIINGVGYGTFDKGYSINQKPISLPNNTQLTALAGYAASGNLSFTAPYSGAISGALMRIEFTPKPFNGGTGGTALNGADDGFLRVYISTSGAQWLRGDSTANNCGAAYVFTTAPTGPGSAQQPLFVPLVEHSKTWFSNALNAARAQGVGYTSSQIKGLTSGSSMTTNVLRQTSARCYLGGDPNLRAANLFGTSAYTQALALGGSSPSTDPSWIAVAKAIGGSDTTFDAGVSGTGKGYWVRYPGTVNSTLATMFGNEAFYLFPLYRGLNPGTKGVIYVKGTVGLSGKLRGRVTVYATGNVGILQDTKYVTDPALNLCSDILGVISGNNIMVADNAVQTPLSISGTGYRNMDATKDVFIDGVLMALNTAFGAEAYYTGPNASSPGNGCEGTPNGRGCLYLTGGVIQEARGPVGLSSGEGFAKRYSYDACALFNPPPYFPTTGRYTDNRYYELDPIGFDVAAMYRSLTPGL